MPTRLRRWGTSIPPRGECYPPEVAPRADRSCPPPRCRPQPCPPQPCPSGVTPRDGMNRTLRAEIGGGHKPLVESSPNHGEFDVHSWDLKSLAFRRPLPVGSRDGA